MTSESIDLLAENPDWIRVLAAYADIEQALAAVPDEPAPEHDDADEDEDEDELPQSKKWMPRVQQVQGVADGRLAPVHGKLIAHGLLKFDLIGRTDGVLYRLTPQSRAAVKNVNLDELTVLQPGELDAEGESVNAAEPKELAVLSR